MKKKGFTLVELLATIVILGILIAIIIFVATGIIRRSKEKSYKVTINEIEKNTNNYLIENNNRLFFLTNNEKGYEYQCVTVENLVDYGYLGNDVINSNVSNDSKAALGDYIYIERDSKTKSVTKTLYTKTNPEYIDTCAKAVNALGDIIFASSPSFNEWSKYKDVTITYRLRNLNDKRTLNDYNFNHSYSGTSTYDDSKDTLENNIKTKLVRVTSNGDLSANITLDNEIITSSKKIIDKIDIVGPVISLGDVKDKKVHGQVTLPLKVTDFGIGVDYSTFTIEDITVKVNDTQIDNIKLEHVSNEKYNLTINNNTIAGNIKIYIARDKVFDELENGNLDIEIDTGIMFENIYKIIYDANGGSGAPSDTTYTYDQDESVNLSDASPIRTNYIFIGWSTDKNATLATYAAGGAYPRNITNNVTLYAIWMYGIWEYECTKTIQSLVIPINGKYQLEVWGAQGGSTHGEGGMGGYAVGTVNLVKGDILYIVVGGVGGLDEGGYNGGGSGAWGAGGTCGAACAPQMAYSGGGATHIGKSNNLLKDTAPSNVFIVAGGGGGNGESREDAHGGDGGGYVGGDGTNPVHPHVAHIYIGHGATQTYGGAGASAGNNCPRGEYGQGASFCGTGYGGAGGGGGWYGGGGSARGHAGGGGGSGYINGVNDGSMQSGVQAGNGHATITYLDS